NHQNILQGILLCLNLDEDQGWDESKRRPIKMRRFKGSIPISSHCIHV
ncbi:hypothetical protein CDAR_379541, partial [Caerostris darwini]